MSTHSSITVRTPDGHYHGVYSHSDGYIEGVGKTLLDHYNSQELAEALVALGHISLLEDTIEAPEGHSFDTPVKGYTIAYHRDRGDELEVFKGRTWESVRRRIGAHYHYLFENGFWYVLAPKVGRTRELLERVL